MYMKKYLIIVCCFNVFFSPKEITYKIMCSYLNLNVHIQILYDERQVLKVNQIYSRYQQDKATR